MSKSFKIFAASCALLTLAVVGAYSEKAPAKPPKQSQAIDQEAVEKLRAMTDHLGSLKQFSVRALNLREDMSESGHRLDFEVAAKLIVSRPNKLKAERVGHLIDQVFYYDGKTLTLHNPSDKVYATDSAPATIEETIDFARNTLGIGYPVSDLIYSNAFPLLMQDVKFAAVVGQEVINGVKCDHLLFSRPGVDFQVWINESGSPLPHKYVVTDTGTPELLSIVTLISEWDVAPTVTDSQFTFVAPEGAKPITFMREKTKSPSNR